MQGAQPQADFVAYLQQLCKRLQGEKHYKEDVAALRMWLDVHCQGEVLQSTPQQAKLLSKIHDQQQLKLKMDRQAQQQTAEIVKLQDHKMVVQKEIDKLRTQISENKGIIDRNGKTNLQLQSQIRQLDTKIHDLQKQMQQNELQFNTDVSSHQQKIKEVDTHQELQLSQMRQQVEALLQEKQQKENKIQLIQQEMVQVEQKAEIMQSQMKNDIMRQIDDKKLIIDRLNQQNMEYQIQLNQLREEVKQLQVQSATLEMKIPAIRQNIINEQSKKYEIETQRLDHKFDELIKKQENEIADGPRARAIARYMEENQVLETQVHELQESIEGYQKAIKKNYIGKYQHYVRQSGHANEALVVQKNELEDMRKLLADEQSTSNAELPDNGDDLAAMQKILRERAQEEAKLRQDIQKLTEMPSISSIRQENEFLRDEIVKLVAQQNRALREGREQIKVIKMQDKIQAERLGRQNMEALIKGRPESETQLQVMRLAQRSMSPQYQKRLNVMSQISQMRQLSKILK